MAKTKAPEPEPEPALELEKAPKEATALSPTVDGIRIEDRVKVEGDQSHFDSVEVPLEESRKDHLTLLATDTVDSEGNITPAE